MLQIGDLVKITPFYTAHYPEWAEQIKDKEAKIIKIKTEVVQSKSLSKEDRATYQHLYGVKPQYDLVELLIQIDNKLFLVSQLGFDKF